MTICARLAEVHLFSSYIKFNQAQIPTKVKRKFRSTEVEMISI